MKLFMVTILQWNSLDKRGNNDSLLNKPKDIAVVAEEIEQVIPALRAKGEIFKDEHIKEIKDTLIPAFIA